MVLVSVLRGFDPLRLHHLLAAPTEDSIPVMDATTEFWRLFEKRASALAAIESADEPVYDEVLAALQAINEDLWLELGLEKGACELIVTAEGNTELFPLVDAVVAKAPKVPGWTVLALKPKTGFPPSIRWEDYEIIIADVLFQAGSQKGSGLVLKLFVPGLDEAHTDDAGNALLRAIDHGLGERAFAEAIEQIDVVPMPAQKPEPSIPLVELEQYLAHRKKSFH